MKSNSRRDGARCYGREGTTSAGAAQTSDHNKAQHGTHRESQTGEPVSVLNCGVNEKARDVERAGKGEWRCEADLGSVSRRQTLWGLRKEAIHAPIGRASTVEGASMVLKRVRGGTERLFNSLGAWILTSVLQR